MGLFFFKIITRHNAFHSRTTVNLQKRVVFIARLTPFGQRMTTLSFDEIVEVRVEKKQWGSRNSRQTRGTLHLCPSDGHAVIYSNRDIDRMTRLADAFPRLPGPAPDLQDAAGAAGPDHHQ